MAIKNTIQSRVLSINYAYDKQKGEYLCKDVNFNVKAKGEDGLPSSDNLISVGNAIGSLLNKMDKTGLDFKDRTTSKLTEI